MSMFIKGENPPKSCYVCGWYNKVQCPVNDGRYYYRVQRHPSCPLIELPPHGRLIDADEIEYEKVYIDDVGKSYEMVGKDDIDDAETVIEAEGETDA